MESGLSSLNTVGTFKLCLFLPFKVIYCISEDIGFGKSNLDYLFTGCLLSFSILFFIVTFLKLGAGIESVVVNYFI